jgi:hypothetical protein
MLCSVMYSIKEYFEHHFGDYVVCWYIELQGFIGSNKQYSGVGMEIIVC